MEISSITNSPMFLVSGAVLIVIIAWFIFRGGSKEPSNRENNEVSDTGKIKKMPVEIISTDETSPKEEKYSLWKIKRNILSKVRSMRKPEIEKRIIQEIKTEQIEIEPISVNETGNATPEESFSEDDIISGEATTSESVDFQEDSNETIVDIEQQSEGEVKPEAAPVYQEETKQEKSHSGSDIFSMFTDDIGEESEVSIFAAKLAPVDINHLREEVENMRKCIRK